MIQQKKIQEEILSERTRVKYQGQEDTLGLLTIIVGSARDAIAHLNIKEKELKKEIESSRTELDYLNGRIKYKKGSERASLNTDSDRLRVKLSNLETEIKSIPNKIEGIKTRASELYDSQAPEEDKRHISPICALINKCLYSQKSGQEQCTSNPLGCSHFPDEARKFIQNGLYTQCGIKVIKPDYK